MTDILACSLLSTVAITMAPIVAPAADGINSFITAGRTDLEHRCDHDDHSLRIKP